jgi:type III secretory pathway lipoprotein EscJ
MAELVQVAVAGDETEAEEMQELLQAAGIDAEIDAGVDDPFTVRVPEGDVEAAREALEALTEPDELLGEP